MTTTDYRPLPSTSMLAGTSYRRPAQSLPEHVTAQSPAVDVMTDLSKVAVVTIGPCASLDEAKHRMIASGVRLLLVPDQHNRIQGVLTYRDINGERPMQYLQTTGGKREEIIVREVMTPLERLDVIDFREVVRAQVGDIVATLKRVGRQHAMVVDTDEDGTQHLRGIFSATQIGKQLGINIETAEVARSFAELEAALA